MGILVFFEQVFINFTDSFRLVDTELFVNGNVQANVQKRIALAHLGEEVLV